MKDDLSLITLYKIYVSSKEFGDPEQIIADNKKAYEDALNALKEENREKGNSEEEKKLVLTKKFIK